MLPTLSGVANWFEAGNWVPWAAVLVGLGLVCMGGDGLVREWRWRRLSTTAVGEVVSVQHQLHKRHPSSTRSDSRRVTKVAVRFSVGADEHRFTQDFGPMWGEVQPGAQLDVRYAPGDPDNARLASFDDTFANVLVPAGMAIAGVVLCGLFGPVAVGQVLSVLFPVSLPPPRQ